MRIRSVLKNLNARREADLKAAAKRIAVDTGAEVLPVAADCRKADDCQRVSERCGCIDILVNNDGAPPLGPIDSFDDLGWHKAPEQNLMYVVRMFARRCHI